MKTEGESFFKKDIQYFLAFAGLGLIVSYIIYFWFPEYVNFIVAEDHLVENLSTFFFLLSFFLALWAMKKYKIWWQLTLIAGLVGLLGFFDEISFGERIFDLDMPEIMGVKIDSAHDFVAVAYLILKNIFGYYGLIVLTAGFCVAVIALFNYQQKYTINDLTAGIHQTLPGNFLILFVFFLTAAVIIDLKEDYVPLVIIEELFEMYAAIALCAYSVSFAKTDVREQIIGLEHARGVRKESILK